MFLCFYLDFMNLIEVNTFKNENKKFIDEDEIQNKNIG